MSELRFQLTYVVMAALLAAHLFWYGVTGSDVAYWSMVAFAVVASCLGARNSSRFFDQTSRLQQQFRLGRGDIGWMPTVARSRFEAFYTHTSTRQLLFWVALVGVGAGLWSLDWVLDTLHGLPRSVGKIGRIFGAGAELWFNLLFGSYLLVAGIQSGLAVFVAKDHQE